MKSLNRNYLHSLCVGFLLSLLLYPLASNAALLCVTSTIPGTDEFKGISGSSSSNIIAVEEDGTLVTYDGATWTTTAITSDPDAEFNDVYIIDGNTGVAVGDNGEVVLQTAGTWANLGSGTGRDLEAVWAYSAAEIYAFGEQGAIQIYNGTSWSDQKPAAGTTNSDDFNDAWGNSTYVYGITDNGTLFRYTRSTNIWTEINTCNIAGSVDFKGIWGDASGNLYFAVELQNDGAVYKYDGSTCVQVVFSTNNELESIYGSTTTGEIYAVGEDGAVLYFDGSTWTNMTQGTEDLNAVWVDPAGVPHYAGDSTEVTSCFRPTADWQMDEATWSGAANEVIDSTSNNNHGQTFNSLAPTSAYLCNGGDFDGSNDYIEIPHNNSLNGSNELTYSAWLNPTSWSGVDQIIAKSVHDGGTGRSQMGIFSASGVLKGRAETLAGRYEVSTTLPGTSQWTHISLVFNGTSLKLYTNGVLRDTSTFSNTTLVQTTDPFLISKRYPDSTYFFHGKIDEVLVFQSAVSATGIQQMYSNYQSGLSWNGAARTCPGGSLHHFEISHDGTALTCEPESITFKACTNASCSSTLTSNVGVTLTPTGWVDGDSKTITGGSNTFQLRKTTAATYTLGVSSSSPAATNAVQCVNTSAGNNSCDITYYDSGFIYDVPNLTSCATSANVTVSAVRLDNTSQTCVPTFQSTTKAVNFWSTYSSPNSGSKQVVINNGTTDTLVATSSPGTGVNLSFNASGQATMTATYDDAGQLSLNSRFTSGALTLSGSDSFVSIPAKLYAFSDDANAACTSNNSTCSVFKTAGSHFNLKVRGACADNSVTPNFVLDNIAVTHTNTAPAVAQGTLGVASFNMASADNGEHLINNQSVSEVGVFTFTATAPTYFGATGPSGTSTFIGRFTPDHFCVSSTSLLNRTDSNTKAACTDSFSYLSEDFTDTFTLTAQRNGATCGDSSKTSNYTGSFSKFASSNLLASDNTSDATETGILNFAAVDSASSTDLSSRINFNTTASTSTGVFSNGSLAVNAKMDIARLGSAPDYAAETALTSVDIGIKPIDTDGVTLASADLTINSASYFNVGTSALYFGRLYADSTFGAEQEGLPMWAEPQYCNAQSSGVCSDWKTKVDDTCSLYTVATPTDTVIGATNTGTNGYWVSATNYNASSGITYTTDSNNHKAGWQVWYTAGGTGGTYVIPFVTHPYLITQNGSASFGLYRGDDRIIFWREIFN